MKKAFLIFISFFSFIYLDGQVTSFSDNTADYIPTLQKIFSSDRNLSNSDIKNIDVFLLGDFSSFWGSITDLEKKSIINLSNQMLKKRLGTDYFLAFIHSLVNIQKSGKWQSDFTDWAKTYDNIINKERGQKIIQFLNQSDSLFLNNILYSSPTTTWISTSNNFKFEYDDEPKIIFPNTSLVCYAYGDSSVIYQTNGIYYMSSNKWVGKGGKITWERALLDPDKVYALLSDYSISLKSRDYRADTVNFYHKDYFGDQPVTGYILERIFADKTGEQAIYPQFYSYQSNFYIKNIFENIDYEGGFSVKGASIIGSGDSINLATIKLFYNNNLFIKSQSKSFSIRKNSIESQDASVVLYINEDSIYHLSLVFKYQDSTKEISFIRDNDRLHPMPFYDTYHKLDMYFEALYWTIGAPEIRMTMLKGSSSSNALFESNNYFSKNRYLKLQGVDEKNPLQYIKDFTDKTGKRYFSVLDFAKYRVIDTRMIRQQIISLALQGFLDYNPNTDMVYVKDKVFNYVEANAGKKDFDVIQFNSVVESLDNAKLSLINYDLKLEGISRVFLSDSQNVVVYPNEQKIIVKKNRDFIFDGLINAGRFNYYGREYYFSYDQFKINMPFVDSMNFYVRSRIPDKYGEYPLIRVRNVIEDMSGELLIDHPSNRSGKIYMPEYPIFNSKKISYVYYDKSCIYQDVYNRDNFFYHINPYTLKNLDKFSTDSLRFDGYLSSGGIFPDIYEPLVIMEDYSLGIHHQTPSDGLPAYGGKGTFINKITMSNQGLHGDGTLKYITSIAHSKDFLFFPDSTIGIADSYVIAERTTGVQYPPVSVENAKISWYPKNDFMAIYTQDKPAIAYKEKVVFNGILDYSPSSLLANGKIEFLNAIMTSKRFVMKNRVFDTDTCDFVLKTFDLNELALETKIYKGHVDFDQRKGTFETAGESSMIRFPANEYICYMDKFDWYMDKEEIDFYTTHRNEIDYTHTSIKDLVDMDLSGSRFVSTHPAQDSLTFIAGKAKYNIKNKQIIAYEVPFIKVADAAIFPKDRIINIATGAVIQPLENSTVLANLDTKYHILQNCNIWIYGKKSYSGKGQYEYIDQNKNSQIINFDKITVNNNLQTIANGKIFDSTNFTLSPYFLFAGNVYLLAPQQFLTFDGGVKISHACDTLPKQWVKINDSINPNNILIPIPPQPKNINGDIIFAGLYFSSQGVAGVYPAFLTKKLYGGDVELVSSNGFLRYDEVSGEYQIASKEKLDGITKKGNYLSLNTKTCDAVGEGKLSLGSNLGRVNMDFYGRVDYKKSDLSTTITANAILDFYFNEKALEMMANDILASELENLNIQDELFLSFLEETLDSATAMSVINDLNLYGNIRKFPKELAHTFVFNDLTFKYIPETKTYISEGRIGISIANNTQVYKYINGIIELSLRRSGDRLTIYLQPFPNVWYFFTYSNGLMQGLSSRKEFNELIINTDSKSRTLESSGQGKGYTYYIATTTTKDRFIKKVYDNIDVESDEY